MLFLLSLVQQHEFSCLVGMPIAVRNVETIEELGHPCPVCHSVIESHFQTLPDNFHITLCSLHIYIYYIVYLTFFMSPYLFIKAIIYLYKKNI